MTAAHAPLSMPGGDVRNHKSPSCLSILPYSNLDLPPYGAQAFRNGDEVTLSGKRGPR